MSSDLWKSYIFSDFVEINPSVKLAGGDTFSFVEMKDLNDGQRSVYPSAERKISGGARFQNGDTLFARITPCLENGKICQVRGLKNNIGFGSTEFLVFRGKPGVSDADFVFYLARYDGVRRFAEQNMVGTSGRQRVGREAFENLILELPPLSIQRRIAAILTALDDKIELNRRMNETLEGIAQALWGEWFGKYASGEEELPEGWRKIKMGECCIRITKGTTPTTLKKSFSDFGVNFIKVESIDENGGFLPEKFSFIDENTNGLLRRSMIEKDDLLFTIAGSLGRSAIVDESILPANTNQAIAIIRPDQSIVSPLYLKYLIRSSDFLETILTKSVHAVQANISLSVISDTEITLPSRDKLHQFSSLIIPIQMAVINNIKQSRTLTSLRDAMLPRLMRGEVLS